jgi:pyruvate/2-oxoglutarate dehydrogenase complex dihydrolipoamide dehydrogenase (E3) component
VFIRQKKVLRGFDEEVSILFRRADVALVVNQMLCFCLYFILFYLDAQVRDFVAEQMSLRGITFHTEQTPQAVTKSDDGLLSLKTNKETIGGFSHVMFATGRRPNTKVKSTCSL